MTLRRRLDLLEASRGRLDMDVNEMSFSEVTYELAMISTPDDLEPLLVAVAAESSQRSIRAGIEGVWASYGMHGLGSGRGGESAHRSRGVACRD